MAKVIDWTIAIFGQYGLVGLFVVSFAESSFFPVPPDVMLIPLCLARPRASMLYATVATVSSVLGAVFAYLVGARGGRPLLLKFTSKDGLSKIQGLFKRFGGWAVGIAAFTPIPFKVFTIASGIFQVRLAPFLIASTLGRGARFFLEAALVLKLGEQVRDIIGTQFELITLMVGLVVAVAAIVWNRKSSVQAPIFSDKRGSGTKPYWRIRLPKSAASPGLSGKRFWAEWGIYAIAGFVFLLIFFEELVELAQPDHAPFLRQIDMGIMTWIRAIRNPFLSTTLTFTATLGSYPFVFACLALAVTYNLFRHRRARAATLAICVIGGLGLAVLTRWAYSLPGPELALPVPDILSRSFAAQPIPVALPFYGMATHMLGSRTRSRARRRAIRVAAGVIIALICFSGIYMGFQWPSEAAAGVVAGAMWLIICIRLLSLTGQGHKLGSKSG
ncbi:MAG TPA: VTT domain-containing protein [Bacillota bacterium]|nr:VTT domain-containing protein [Bacillota bacterium]